VSVSHPSSTTPRLTHIHQDWAYPRVIDIARSINYSALDPDVVGRVDGTHDGYLDIFVHDVNIFQ
jgi:hypothetical protein